MAKKERKLYSINKSFAENSINALFSTIEIYNKPNIAYRSETALIILAHAWEILIKSILYKQSNKLVKKYVQASLKEDDETTEIVGLKKVTELYCIGKEKMALKEHLDLLRKTRNRIMHAYILPSEAESIIWGLFQKSFEFFDKVLTLEFPSLKTKLKYPFILPIGFKKPFAKEQFLKSFGKKNIPLFDDILNVSKKLNQEGIEETVIVPITFLYDKKTKITNADLILAIDPDGENTVNFEKSIRLDENSSRSESPIPLEECRKYFTISASKLRKELSMSSTKKFPYRPKIYKDITDEKYHQIYWWKDPSDGKKYFSEVGRKKILEWIEVAEKNNN